MSDRPIIQKGDTALDKSQTNVDASKHVAVSKSSTDNRSFVDSSTHSDNHSQTDSRTFSDSSTHLDDHSRTVSRSTVNKNVSGHVVIEHYVDNRSVPAPVRKGAAPMVVVGVTVAAAALAIVYAIWRMSAPVPPQTTVAVPASEQAIAGGDAREQALRQPMRTPDANRQSSRPAAPVESGLSAAPAASRVEGGRTPESTPVPAPVPVVLANAVPAGAMAVRLLDQGGDADPASAMLQTEIDGVDPFTDAFVSSGAFAEAFGGSPARLQGSALGTALVVILGRVSDSVSSQGSLEQDLKSADVRISARLFKPGQAFMSRSVQVRATGAGFSPQAARDAGREKAVKQLADEVRKFAGR